MPEPMSVDELEIIKAELLSDDDRINLECFAEALRVTGKAGAAIWINAALETIDRLAETALSLLGDQSAPEQPTHHTNDCDLLIRHRACSCPFGETDPYGRSADQ